MTLHPTDGERGCLLLRCNHALGDGLRLVAAASEFATWADGQPVSFDLLKKLVKNKASLPKRSLPQLAADFVTAATLDMLSDEDPTCFHAPGTLFPRANQRTNVTSHVALESIKAIRRAVRGS